MARRLILVIQKLRRSYIYMHVRFNLFPITVINIRFNLEFEESLWILYNFIVKKTHYDYQDKGSDMTCSCSRMKNDGSNLCLCSGV